MASENKEQKKPADMSPEERATFYDTRIKQKIALDEGRLETISNIGYIVGSNLLRRDDSPYGQMGKYSGKNSYAQFISSDNANQIRAQEYNQRKKEYEALGIPDEPVITNDQINASGTISIRDSFNKIDLNRLEKIVSANSPGRNISREALSKEKEKLDKKAEEYFAKNKEKYEYNEEEKALIQKYTNVETFYKKKEALENKERDHFIKTAEDYKYTEEDKKLLGEIKNYRDLLFNIFENSSSLNMINEMRMNMDNQMIDNFYKGFEEKETSKQ